MTKTYRKLVANYPPLHPTPLKIGLNRAQAQNDKDLQQTSRVLFALTPYTANNIVLHYTLKFEPQHKTTSHTTAK